jgi:hypothetical protein
LSVTDVDALFPIRTGGLRTDYPVDVAAAAHGQKFLVNTILGDSDNVPIEITMNWPERRSTCGWSAEMARATGG